MGEAMVLQQPIRRHTTIKKSLPSCHWIPHNILFHNKQHVLGFDGWIVIEAIFLFSLSFLPQDSR
jgi:hypothetical protein